MAKELHLILPKVARGDFGFKLMLTKSTQNNPQMMSMIGFGFRVDKNVINEYKDELIKIFPEYSIHKIDKISWIVHQTEWHNEPLIRTITSAKCGKRNAVLRNS